MCRCQSPLDKFLNTNFPKKNNNNNRLNGPNMAWVLSVLMITWTNTVAYGTGRAQENPIFLPIFLHRAHEWHRKPLTNKKYCSNRVTNWSHYLNRLASHSSTRIPSIVAYDFGSLVLIVWVRVFRIHFQKHRESHFKPHILARVGWGKGKAKITHFRGFANLSNNPHWVAAERKRTFKPVIIK